MTTLRAEYPLKWPDGWTRTPHLHRDMGHAFKVLPGKAVDELEFELTMLGAADAVVSSWLDVSARGLRLDKARNQLPDPGVALRFIRGKREYVLARDHYLTPLGNLRSIGLAVAGLRSLERHGGADMMDRAFEGFRALPPPSSAPKPRTWREVLDLVGLDGPAFAVLAGAEAAFKTKARTAHPDMPGGSVDDMAALNAAIAAAREELRS